MHKSLVFLIIALLCNTVVFSQTLTIGTHGISPRDAHSDTLDVFDRAFNGLLNVGVETQMYLEGSVDGQSLASPTWAVTQAPGTSAAAITVTVDVDTATQVAVFTPDVVGTYVVEFADGAEVASVTINAGTYMGMEDGGCANCHSGKASQWAETGHADMLVRGLNGTASSHYGANCITCHTVGYDVNASNGGFDDFVFAFPQTLAEGVYDSTVALYPSAMKRANIQCESCHGPGSEHFGNTSDSKMVSPLGSDNCALCHDDGTHHVYPEQWDVSKHGNPELLRYGTRTSCAPCHSGAGFVEFLKGGRQDLTEAPEATAITCATCHEPHSAENAHQLRTVDPVELPNGDVVDGGRGNLCANCHNSRRNALERAASDRPEPHHGPQAEVLFGVNVPTFGKMLPTSAHSEIENTCVACHMAPGHVDENDNVLTAGAHSFSVIDINGNDNVAICQNCHGDVGTSFAEKKYYFNGNADHDGDGEEEGLQHEVEGLLHSLALLLHPKDSLEVDATDENYIYTATEKSAAYNYYLIEEDRSLGVHNPAFAVALLKVTIQAVLNNSGVGDIVAIDDVPDDQGKQVLIVWDKLVDDGVAVDPIVTYTVKRLDGDVWTGVGQHTADGSARYGLVVPTVYNATPGDTVMTTFKIVGITRSGDSHESIPAEGYSLDNLDPAAPSGLLAQSSGNDVILTWEDPVDEDFNYFAVYRSEASGFIPSEENLIASLTGTDFVDSELTAQKTYYYKISAIDFNRNESEPSDEASVLVTSVESSEASVPTEFSLAQNYPNPFNPTTVIEFGIPNNEKVTINIYDIRGVHVRTLAHGTFAAGYHTLKWDGYNDIGQLVSAGTYLYRLESRSHTFSKKMVFLK